MTRIDRRTFAKSGLLVASVALSPSPSQERAAGDVRVTGLRAEDLTNPIGLDVAQPHLSWRLESTRRNVRQSAYRVLVGASAAEVAAGRGDLWDSGKVASDRSLDIAYTGQPLTSRQRCWWTVRVWDEAGRAATPPSPASWEMGLLTPADWSAAWLAVETPEDGGDREAGLPWIWGRAPRDPSDRRFRLAIELKAPAKAAILTVGAGNGLAGLWLDGGALDYRRGPTITFGLEPLARIELGPLAAGSHVLGAEVKSSPPNPFFQIGSCFTALLRVHYEDGRVERFTAGPNWKTSLDTDPAWATVDFDDKAWTPAIPASGHAAPPWPPRPAMYLRSEFQADKPVISARLYATALGAYEAFLNGAKVGDALLAPESQDFRKRVRYRVYDVSAMIRPGANVIGAHVGDGWYASFVAPGSRYSFGPAPRRFIGQLELIFADGSRKIVVTDPGWRAASSPVLQSEIYDGEVFDARRDQDGWSAPHFNADAWPAAAIGEPPPAPLTAQVDPPIRVTQTLAPRSVSQPKPDVYVFDFGQNFAGFCRLHVKGPPGAQVTLRFAEILRHDGDVDQSNLRSARATDVYTLRGDPAGEAWQPAFTYHGFRYVQVTGFPGEPTTASLQGMVIHSDLPVTGLLRIDNPLIEQIWRNTVWSQRSNFVGIPTDCPQRDERLGWMGDANAFWDAAAFNMDVYPFTERFAGDMRDAQGASGGYADYSPAALKLNEQSSPGWADAGIGLPWTAWSRSGDTSIIDQNWEAMIRYLHYIEAANPDHIWRHQRGLDFGDWLALDAKSPGDPTTPKDLIGTAWWARSTQRVIDMAKATGRAAEAERYSAMLNAIIAAFQSAFVKPDGQVGNGSQTSYILGLRFGLIQTSLRGAAAKRLTADIERRGVLLSTGFLGTPNSLDVLADNGRPDLVYSLLLRTAYPSWGYMIAKGATTMWERWNGDVGDVAMNSYNHYAFGAVSGFLFRRIAGIDAGAPGFKEVVVRPVLDPRVKRGGGDYQSAMGPISTGWSQGPGGAFDLTVEIPANSAGRIHLPAAPHQQVREGRRALAGRRDLSAERTATEVVVHTGSGRYQFHVGAGER
ncbi:MAG TPA: family 78 glycoside hydrolase catalytic domain [Caulobacteraceae bacterium]|nr:family 78 glycoside hydrolase catalytic domain [Caulobacteraceae bacterium]